MTKPQKKEMMNKYCKPFLAEMFGTFALTFFGCGTAVITNCSTDNYPGYLLTALAFGLVLTVLVYTIGNTSGCHVNPAVSLAMLIRKKLSAYQFFGYLAAQCAGAVIAGGCLAILFMGKGTSLGTNGLYEGRIGASLVLECLMTFLFVLSILKVTSDEKKSNVAGLVIGASLFLVHIFGIGFTGTSVNPARSLGVAVFAGGDALRNLWVFIAAPLVGAALAALADKMFTKKSVTTEPAEKEASDEKEG